MTVKCIFAQQYVCVCIGQAIIHSASVHPSSKCNSTLQCNLKEAVLWNYDSPEAITDLDQFKFYSRFIKGVKVTTKGRSVDALWWICGQGEGTYRFIYRSAHIWIWATALVDINFTRVRVDGELITEEWTTLSDGKLLQFILLHASEKGIRVCRMKEDL